ncbi:phenylalanine--tRNA ligase beta subunit-related protein [Streptomyces sp. NPDC051940]|uniref:B3/B4 domain-containing protein n=1 Tax=Streptomyces sp. NPDC051940 TaxID=3155675 RepID=UPI0034439FC7
MYFQHADALRSDFPQLTACALYAEGIGKDAVVDARVEHYCALARERLAGGTESALPEIQAWRRAFTAMGLRPTQYRCASESLLRRFRREGALPRIHPLIDLCNAVSMAYAIPVAVLDVDRIAGPGLEVRYALGSEVYETFSGESENPEPGEVTFVDGTGRAHARRWTNRQSGYSAVSEGTRRVLVVAEALHDSATDDVRRLGLALSGEIASLWGGVPLRGGLGGGGRFVFGG